MVVSYLRTVDEAKQVKMKAVPLVFLGEPVLPEPQDKDLIVIPI